MRGFFRKLSGRGYEVVQVRSKRFRNGSVKNANPDIEIIADMFTKLAEYDEAVLVSGGGDFCRYFPTSDAHWQAGLRW